MAEERRMRTYHGVAASSVNDERGGRYAGEGSKQTVIGSSPITYPAQPANSPWHHDPCPREPPLGYAIDGMECVGEPQEVRASKTASSEEGSPPSGSRSDA